jgi:2-oxoisovalerate dehydrogenase E1 component
VLLLQEPSITLGPLSEISAFINEECFEWLDGPVMRCASLDTPIPHDKGLEEGFMAQSKLVEKLDILLQY